MKKRTIEHQLSLDPASVISAVESAYRTHWEGRAVCPHSSFLRFPSSSNRIIALPAYLDDAASSSAGIKWISSFPANVGRGLPRASAIIVLNDPETGVPVSVMDGSAVSAARTGAFAAIAARAVVAAGSATSVAVIGCGPIARSVVTYLGLVMPRFSSLAAFDAVPERAAAFVAEHEHRADRATAAPSMEEAIRSAGVVIFATTAPAPYVHDASLFERCRLVLHVSLRDLGPSVIERCFNVVDDREHAVREQTSLHRVALANPGKRVVDADVGDLIWGGVAPPPDGTVAVSPFGLGVLDIGLATHVMNRALAAGQTLNVEDFFESGDDAAQSRADGEKIHA